VNVSDSERTKDEAASAIDLARGLFLREDNFYGCAESTLVTLQVIFGLPDAGDSSAAMALNGGVAYSGGICGALSGAAIALGRLAEHRIPDHRQAKRTARMLTQMLIRDFEDQFSGHNCSDLIDFEISIPEQHDAFIESGEWRDTCMRQIEFSVTRLHAFADEAVWNETVAPFLQE
jgi:C_GCAxxG_C_C family probable redox protein